MKTLTLTQPFATLVAFGDKLIETRSWSTKYRGPLAIHAGAGLGPVGNRRGLVRLLRGSHFDTPYPRVYTPNVPCIPHMPIGGDATMTDQGLLRTRDVAEMLTVSERQIRDMAQQGEIPAIRIGGEWRFERAAIVQWLERQRTGPKESAT